MKQLKGMPASGGVAVGRVLWIREPGCDPAAAPVERAGTEKRSSQTDAASIGTGSQSMRSEAASPSVDASLRILEDAISAAREELEALRLRTEVAVGAEAAAIIEVQQMMLEDDDFTDAMRAGIRESGRIVSESASESALESTSESASGAALGAGEQFAETFAAMEDAYMRERAADVRDVAARVARIARGERELDPAAALGEDDGEGFIVVAEDLTPSQTLRLDRKRILAFITRKGSDNSHSAILARMMGIPAVVAVGGLTEVLEEWRKEQCGEDAPVWRDAHAGSDAKPIHCAVVDGDSGTVQFDPDSESMRIGRESADTAAAEREALKALIGLPTETVDGRRVLLYANIGSPEDVDAVLANDGEGVGLFRSEFLYLDRSDWPDEETQYRTYRAVAERMGGRRVVIRTLDIGADKQAGYFGLDEEENPAMGLRAIRVCRERPGIFRTQLRAILRAAAHGLIAVMYPMIVSEEEVTFAKAALADARAELEMEGIPYGPVEQGIMVETPAAVLIADRLAPMVDFFSIGSNDLTQYTLAADRQNPKLRDCCDPHHPAVLKLIEMTVESGHRAGIWVGLCGELGADLTLTEAFLDLGLDELSVSPAMLLKVREAVRNAGVSEKVRQNAGSLH